MKYVHFLYFIKYSVSRELLHHPLFSPISIQDRERDGIIKQFVAHWHPKFDMNMMITFSCQSAVGGSTAAELLHVVNVLPGQGEAIQLLIYTKFCACFLSDFTKYVYFLLKNVIKIG